MKDTFEHPAQALTQDKPFVYAAYSKHAFYLRMLISEYMLKQGVVPLNPFMIFDYFLADTIDRDTVREANNNLVKRSDELWVFGAISDGVLSEIRLAKESNKPIRFYKYADGCFSETVKSDVQYESEIEQFKGLV